MIANWDACPALWDLIRHEVDRRGIPGQFILTGSEQDSSRSHQGVPVFHSGIGRYALRRMRTMSLYETGEGDGSASLRSLMDGSFEAARSQLSIEGYAHAIYRGGWPLAMAEGGGSAASLSVARSYYGDLVKKDLFSIADLPLRKDPDRAHRLLRSLSRHVAGECPDRLLLEEARMDRGTLRKYLLALRRLFIVDDLLAWLPKLRSKTAVRRAPARHLCDPSLAVCALGLSPDALFLDMDLFRSLLKSLAAHELMVCTDILGGLAPPLPGQKGARGRRRASDEGLAVRPLPVRRLGRGGHGEGRQHVEEGGERSVRKANVLRDPDDRGMGVSAGRWHLRHPYRVPKALA